MGEDIPAYKVVNAQGILSGAAAFETFDMQKLLLEQEGVEARLTEKGWKVDLKRYQWKNCCRKGNMILFQEEKICRHWRGMVLRLWM